MYIRTLNGKVEHACTVFPRVEAAATINLTCSSTAATIRGQLQFEGGYYIPCAYTRSTRAHAYKLLHHHTRTPRGWGGLGSMTP